MIRLVVYQMINSDGNWFLFGNESRVISTQLNIIIRRGLLALNYEQEYCKRATNTQFFIIRREL